MTPKAKPTPQSPYFLLILAILNTGACSSYVDNENTRTVSERMIYGTDSFLEYGQVIGTEEQRWADSTAAIIGPESGIVTGVQCSGSTCNLITSPWVMNPTTGVRICNGVRFKHQPQLARCSGVLVGPSLIATAGHCYDSPTCADGPTIVFGFVADANGNAPTTLPAANVFSCTGVTRALGTGDEQEDWALVQLDRPVTRPIMNIRYAGAVPLGAPVVLLGYPIGLPLKVASDAQVLAFGPLGKQLYHNADEYGGSSGGPVVNLLTGVVEGLHHGAGGGGPGDFPLSTDSEGTCLAPSSCPMTGCTSTPEGLAEASLTKQFSARVPLAPALAVAAAL
jgi:hypothetical protein